MSFAHFFFQDYHSLLYFPKIIKFVGLQRQLRSSSSLHFKDFNVFRQAYHNLLCLETINVLGLAETIKAICFFTFPRLSESFVSRLPQSSLLFQGYQSLLSCEDYQCLLLSTFSKTMGVFCFKDYQSLLSRLQCLLYYSRLQVLLLIYLMPLTLFLLIGFTA